MNTFPVKAAPPPGKYEEELKEVLKKLEICVSLRKTPIDPEWPKGKDFLALRSSILILDPKSKTRSRHHPRWKQPVAAVDNAFPDLLVKNWIERFLQRAEASLDAPDWVPPTIRLMIFKLGSHPTTGHKFEKTAMLAKAIASGNKQATGENVAAMLSLCSDKFRSLCKSELSSPDHIPSKWAPFVEYSAAVEIMREHRAYIQQHGRQLISLGEFLVWLENSQFADFQKKLSSFMSFSDMKESEAEKQKKQNRRRKRKERDRKRSKK